MSKVITDLSDPQVAMYAESREVQLHHLYEPEPGVFIAESCKVTERALAAGYEPISFLLEPKQAEGEAKKLLEEHPEVPCFLAEPEVLKEIIGYGMTRGVLCAMRRKALPKVSDFGPEVKRVAVLENVQNPTNLGAIFRSAAALGMDAVLLTPGCTDPLYRRAIRVSMGTVFQVPWAFLGKEKGSWPEKGMEELKRQGFQTIAMALCEDSVSLSEIRPGKEDRIAVLLGTEGEGLSDETLALCDRKVIIPMSHGVDSLNVAAASAVAFWELGRNKTDGR